MILILLLPLALLYFVPAIVAVARGRQVGVVLVLNAAFGWTFLGWIGAFAIAVSSPPPPQPVLIWPAFSYPPYPPNAYPLPHSAGPQPPFPPQPPSPTLNPPRW